MSEPAEGMTFATEDGSFSFTVPPEVADLLERAAEKSGLEVSELVSRVLNDHDTVRRLLRDRFGIDIDTL